MSTRNLATISISVALAIVLGRLMPLLYGAIPISRNLVNAPVFSFLLTATIYKTRQTRTIALFGLIYGLYMMHISVFAGASIIVGGLIGEVLSRIFIGEYDSSLKIALAGPLFSAGSVFASFLVVTYIIDSVRYRFPGTWALLAMFVYVYALGLVASFAATKLVSGKIHPNTVVTK